MDKVAVLAGAALTSRSHVSLTGHSVLIVTGRQPLGLRVIEE